MTNQTPPSLPEAMEQALRARIEDLNDLAAVLRPDHAATVRSVASSLATIADGQVPIVPAPSTGYRLIYVGDHAERVEAVLSALLPAMLHVFSVGGDVLSFGQVAKESGPYILTDRAIGEAEMRTRANEFADRCSRQLHGCSVEWIAANLRVEA